MYYTSFFFNWTKSAALYVAGSSSTMNSLASAHLVRTAVSSARLVTHIGLPDDAPRDNFPPWRDQPAALESLQSPLPTFQPPPNAAKQLLRLAKSKMYLDSCPVQLEYLTPIPQSTSEFDAVSKGHFLNIVPSKQWPSADFK